MSRWVHLSAGHRGQPQLRLHELRHVPLVDADHLPAHHARLLGGCLQQGEVDLMSDVHLHRFSVAEYETYSATVNIKNNMFRNYIFNEWYYPRSNLIREKGTYDYHLTGLKQINRRPNHLKSGQQEYKYLSMLIPLRPAGLRHPSGPQRPSVTGLTLCMCADH